MNVRDGAVALTSTPAVYTREGTVYASSRDVAAFFGKQHRSVLDSIKVLMEQASSIEPNFRPASIKAGEAWPVLVCKHCVRYRFD